MSNAVRVVASLVIGLVLAVSYNAWPLTDDLTQARAALGGPQSIDMFSYAGGLLVGMFLWQVSSVPWTSLPARLQAYLLAQVQFYQFVAVGGACIVVLIYF